MNIINVEHLYKIYGEKIIFDDASFGIQKGDKIGIVGILYLHIKGRSGYRKINAS